MTRHRPHTPSRAVPADLATAAELHALTRPGPGACVSWTGPVDGHGAPLLYVGRRRWPARRVILAAAVGGLPAGTRVAVTCGRRTCVAVAHLRVAGGPGHAAAPAQPALDGRKPPGPPSGHPHPPTGGHAPDWRRGAACWGDSHTVPDGPAGDAAAARAVHICLRHCPVLAACAADATAHPPVGMVQAGIRFVAAGHRGHGTPARIQPADPGHGPWCLPTTTTRRRP